MPLLHDLLGYSVYCLFTLSEISTLHSLTLLLRLHSALQLLIVGQEGDWEPNTTLRATS